MTNPMDTLPSFDRVSIRAVLVTDGQDPSAALAQAGIFDPIAIPVVLGDDPSEAHRRLGDTLTPNLTAVLEPDEEDELEYQPSVQPDLFSETPPASGPERASATTLPPAFGHRTFAPVVGRSPT